MTLAPVLDGISLAEACDYQFRPGLIAQEKIDGVRAWLDCDTGQLTGRNTPQGFLAAPLPAGCVFDGELVKDRYHAFDLLKLHGQDVTGEPLRWRLAQLSKVIRLSNGAILAVEQSNDPQELAHAVNNRGGEGIVVKRADSSYGRGRWIKIKRTMTLDLIVLSADEIKNSAEVSDEKGKSLGRINGAGHCKPGEIIEVKAMQFTDSGKLRHGNYIRTRFDKMKLTLA